MITLALIAIDRRLIKIANRQFDYVTIATIATTVIKISEKDLYLLPFCAPFGVVINRLA